MNIYDDEDLVPCANCRTPTHISVGRVTYCPDCYNKIRQRTRELEKVAGIEEYTFEAEETRNIQITVKAKSKKEAKKKAEAGQWTGYLQGGKKTIKVIKCLNK